jgi:hypothetical protein
MVRVAVHEVARGGFLSGNWTPLPIASSTCLPLPDACSPCRDSRIRPEGPSLPPSLHGTAPGVASGYRPRSPQNDLKEIVEDSLEELFCVWDARFRESYGGLPPRVRELLERFLKAST